LGFDSSPLYPFLFLRDKGIKSFFDTFFAGGFYINNESVESPFDVCSTDLSSGFTRLRRGLPAVLMAGLTPDSYRERLAID